MDNCTKKGHPFPFLSDLAMLLNYVRVNINKTNGGKRQRKREGKTVAKNVQLKALQAVKAANFIYLLAYKFI